MGRERATNQVVELLELQSRLLPVEGTDKHTICTDMRIGVAECDEPIGSISTKRAFIQLELDGAELSPGPRLGEPLKKGERQEVDIVSTRTAKAIAEGGISASLTAAGVPDASARMKLEGNYTTLMRSETHSKQILEDSHVTARGGERWEIKDGNARLDGTYISSSDTLCTIDKLSGANRIGVRVIGYVLKRDLDFTPNKGNSLWRCKTVNKDRVLTAFFAKKIGIKDDHGEKLIVSYQDLDNE